MELQIVVIGIKEEWLENGVSSRTSSADVRHSVRFGIVGPLEALGEWGRAKAAPLDEIGEKTYGMTCKVPHVLCEKLEMRLLVMEGAAEHGAQCRPVAVECGSTFPRVAFIEKDDDCLKAVLDLSRAENIKFANICSYFPSMDLLYNINNHQSSLGSLLTLHFYANNPRLPYHQLEWSASNSSISSNKLSLLDTTIFEVCKIKRIPVFGSRWQEVLPMPCSSTARRIERPYHASPTSLAEFRAASDDEEDLWCVKKLSRCFPVTDSGLHHQRTQDYWIATVNTEHMENHVLEITLRLPLCDSTEQYVYGKTILTACMLGQGTHGTIDIPVHCSSSSEAAAHALWVILHIQYTLHYPFTNKNNNFRLLRSKQSYDAVSSKKPVGHRGLGRTFTRREALPVSRGIKLAENSIDAMNVAYSRGCEMVEFDVMLTDDGVPIVFHDPVVDLLAKAGPSVVSTEKQTQNLVPTSIPVHYLTEKQLRWVLKQSTNLGGGPQPKLKLMLLRYWSDIVALARQDQIGNPSTRNSVPSSLIARRIDITHPVPTLKELLLRTPKALRLNIEVKYPFQPIWDENLFLQKDVFEINRFVDSILEVVFSCVEDERYIAFSSFEPDVCVALAAKQSRFEVLFLSDTAESEDLKDYRAYYVEGAIQFASNHKLSGISIRSSTLQETQPCENYGALVIDAAHRRGLKVWTWGEANDDPNFVKQQIDSLNVDGVITDNIM